MILSPFDCTCHKLSCRVIGRRECELPQTKNICIILLSNDADIFCLKQFALSLCYDTIGQPMTRAVNKDKCHFSYRIIIYLCSRTINKDDYE